jgi:hypothetical protein
MFIETNQINNISSSGATYLLYQYVTPTEFISLVFTVFYKYFIPTGFRNSVILPTNFTCTPIRVYSWIDLLLL